MSFPIYTVIWCLLAIGKPTQSLKTYDTLLSASQEYKYIWKSKWSVVKVLYICARYGAFVDTAIAVHERVSNVGSSSCRVASVFDVLFAGVGMTVTERNLGLIISVILMIRTYAQYNKSKKLLAFFFLLWLFAAAFNSWDAFQWARSFTTDSLPPLTSCNVEPNALAVSFYAIMLGIETAAMLAVLITVAVLQFVAPVKSHLNLSVRTFLMNLFQIPLQGVGETSNSPMRIIHSISACHLVIHVREVAKKDIRGNTTRPITSGLEFAGPPATLESGGVEPTESFPIGLQKGLAPLSEFELAVHKPANLLGLVPVMGLVPLHRLTRGSPVCLTQTGMDPVGPEARALGLWRARLGLGPGLGVFTSPSPPKPGPDPGWARAAGPDGPLCTLKAGPSIHHGPY
ncbi:hypothetical protein GGX14DRAFT_618479 [Mycena pura]|uniref:DUF6533 domain-containing protein n=1 Tax=Mycena pura TaxID=153505 RepID=A0AAD6UJK0_9AGAR|nr:hypothetical protein GGX14DRAFT_618479 [Mycena pura]